MWVCVSRVSQENKNYSEYLKQRKHNSGTWWATWSGKRSREQSPGRLVKACLLGRPAKPSAFYITRNYIVQNYYSLHNDNYFVVLQSLSHIQLFETPWTAARQASLPFTISRSLLKLTSIESVMLSNHFILCHPLLLLPPVFPQPPEAGSFPMSLLFLSGGQNIGASASASVLPMNIQDWSPLGWTGWISLQSKGLSRVLSNTTVWKHQFFGAQPSLWSGSHMTN